MKPLYLSLCGINSFVEKQEIDFTAVAADRIFCISGPTGSGKTTILDSIVIALYAPKSHTRGGLKDYVNLGCDRGEIVFRFSQGDGTYEVTRTLRRSGGVSAALRRVDTGEVLADQSERVTEKIVEMLRLKYEDFSKVVVLEQGQFAKFMKAPRQERNHAVAQLFDLSRFEALKDNFNTACRSAEKSADENKRALEEYGDVSASRVRELEAEGRRRNEEVKDYAAQRGRLSAERLKSAELRAAFLQCERAEADKAEALSALARMRAAKESLDARKAKLTENERRLKSLRDAAAGAEAVLGKLAEAETDRKKMDALDAERRRLLTRHEEISTQLRGLDARDQTEKDEISVFRSQISGTVRDVARAAELPDGFKGDAAAFASLAAVLKTKSDGLAKNAAETERAAADAEKARTGRTAAENLAAASLRAKNELAARLEEAKTRLRKILSQNAAAVVANGLKAGDTCPVCGGTVSAAHLHAAEGTDGRAAQEAVDGIVSEQESNAALASQAAERLRQSVCAAQIAEEKRAELKAEYEALTVGVRDAALLPDTVQIAVRAQRAAEALALAETRLLTLGRERATAEAEKKRVTEDGIKNQTEREELRRRMEARLGGLEPESLREKAETDRAAYLSAENAFASVREVYDKDYAAYAAGSAAANEKLSAAERVLAKKSGVPFDAALAEKQDERLKELDGLIAAAQTAAATAAAESVSLGARLTKKRELEKTGKELGHRLDLMTQLKKLFGGDRFLEFAAEEYILDFTESASAILSGLTDGKYTLEYESGADSDFYVRDFLAENERRKVKTLSGGETFLASLSVAIAISREIASGHSFEFFFLDEGFGTLHEKAIDTVAEALRRLSAETVVGLVSHRSELVDRIASRIVVTPASEEGGSRLDFVCG